MTPGLLTAADETLTHQIAETFATVGQTDINWTEKLWVSAHAPDASAQLVFGLGKYPNRGVLDGFAGARKGETQWNVRGSRRLSPTPDLLSVGPLHYHIVEPLKSVRCVLEANDIVPLSFDVTFTGTLPPSLNEKWIERSPDGYRITEDLQRYDQVGRASGWASIDGERVELDGVSWRSFRDRSWGVRRSVGKPVADVAPLLFSTSAAVFAVWLPAELTRADGSIYGLLVFVQQVAGDSENITRFQGHEQAPDGTEKPFAWVGHDLRYDPQNRRCLGGTLTVRDAEHGERVITITPVAPGSAALRLGGGAYFGIDGHYQGEWRGELVVEGERVDGLDTPEVARRFHQLADTLMRVEDPVGGGVGYANLEGMVLGAFPDLGLTAESSFI